MGVQDSSRLTWEPAHRAQTSQDLSAFPWNIRASSQLAGLLHHRVRGWSLGDNPSAEACQAHTLLLGTESPSINEKWH